MIKTLSILLKQDKERFVVPKGVQDVIPVKAIYDDGIFQVGRDKFTRSFKFTDINYAVASREDKEAMFLEYSELLNSFDSGATTKITINNRRLNRLDFEKTILMPLKGDALDEYREEYNKMLLERATGANAYTQEKYITISVNKKNVEEARSYFARVGADLIAHFGRLGSKCVEMETDERLRIFHDFYRAGEETSFRFDMKETRKKGHDFKDFICPDSIHQAAELKSNLYVSERVKPLNEQIYYLVDNINTAINRGKQISFRYFHYDQHRKEVPNNDGKRYFFSPYCLVWNEDHYYAIGYSEKHRKLGTFRVDRMKEVEILSADAAAKPADFNLPEFTRRVFDMYDGETKKVTLVCKNDLMNYIVDRFGDEVDTVPGDCGHFRAVAEVSVSQTFFAWVFQFNGDIRITAPEEVVLQYGEMLKNALQT